MAPTLEQLDDDPPSPQEYRMRLVFNIFHRLVPYLVLLSFIPILLVLSFLAGLAVWNNVASGWDVPVYLQYGEGHVPHSQFNLPLVVPNQPYGLTLWLEVPAVPMNYNLGNFMASLTLTTTSSKPIVKFTRPAIALPPKKGYIPFFSSPTTTKIRIDLTDGYKPSISTLVAMVEIGRSDSWRSLGAGEARELSVVSAKLAAIVQHRGVWGIGARFPLTFAVFASAAFFSVSFSIVAACLLPAMVRSLMREEAKKVTKQEEETVEPPTGRASPPPSYAQVKEEYSSDETGTLRRRSRRKSSTKPSPFLTSGQASTSIRPLRHHRSRILDSDSD